MPIFADFITFSTVIYPLNKSNDILPQMKMVLGYRDSEIFMRDLFIIVSSTFK